MALIGTSPPFTRLLELAHRVSSSDTTILLSGETGTGKEAVARAIHMRSPRRRGAFVPLDCGSIPEELLEAELFGHERGAFTGADRRRPGRVRQAHHGTLYLDGAHDMRPHSQARLLRVLENREILPLGARIPERVDFRVIAAAPPDLAERVARGSFRADLYYRLKVVELSLPPLRERQGDIRELAQEFLREFARTYAKPVRCFAPAVLEILRRYRWPGNVRELRNVVEASVAATRGETISESDLPLALRIAAEECGNAAEATAHATTPPSAAATRPATESGPTFQEKVCAFQRQLILSALGHNLWNFRSAAEGLGLERHQLKYLCAKLDIRRPRA